MIPVAFLAFWPQSKKTAKESEDVINSYTTGSRLLHFAGMLHLRQDQG
jgi:hypothetical protein